MMTAEEVIGRIHASRETGRKSGLSNTAELMTFLNCEPSVPVIHVAGTNGKGSICAVTECVLRHAGYRTGLYTSPFLQVYNERIRIDGRPVDDRELAEAGATMLSTGLMMHSFQPVASSTPPFSASSSAFSWRGAYFMP